MAQFEPKLLAQIRPIMLAQTEPKYPNISEYIKNARFQYPRAYEPWSESEKELLNKAMEYTNDLDLLTCCFKRGKGSIESCGKRILFEKAENETKPAANKPHSA